MSARKTGLGETVSNAADLLAKRRADREARKLGSTPEGSGSEVSAEQAAVDGAPQTSPPPRSGTARLFGEFEGGLKAKVEELQRRLDEAGARSIPTHKIRPSRFYNRFVADLDPAADADFKSLLQDIKRDGGNAIPVLVNRDPETDSYELVYGHRRWAACQLANYDVKAYVVEGLDPREMAILQVKENTQRKTPSILDRAMQLLSHKDSGVWEDQKSMAEGLQMSVSYVSMLLDIGKHVPPTVQMVHPNHHSLTYKQCKRLAALAKEEPAALKSRIEWVRTRKGGSLTSEQATKHLLTGDTSFSEGTGPKAMLSSSSSGLTLRIRGLSASKTLALVSLIEEMLKTHKLQQSEGVDE